MTSKNGEHSTGNLTSSPSTVVIVVSRNIYPQDSTIFKVPGKQLFSSTLFLERVETKIIKIPLDNSCLSGRFVCDCV